MSKEISIYANNCNITISEDKSYRINEGYNKSKYDFEYYSGDCLHNYESGFYEQCSIKISEDNNFIRSVILHSFGGNTFKEKDFFIVENDNIIILIGNSLFCLELSTLKKVWTVECDESLCFGVYGFDDGYITHGEVVISKINKEGRLEWKFYGRDIFVTPEDKENFFVSKNIISVTDWVNNVYLIDVNGKEIRVNKKYSNLLEIVMEMRNLIDSPETDLVWSRFNTIDEVMKDLDSCIDKLELNDKSVIKDIKYMFAPTGSYQEISINSGWGDKFIELSKRVDELVK